MSHFNGYIAVHIGHPLYEVHYDDANYASSVHGGFTFSGHSYNYKWEEIPEECRDNDYWMLGWDTAHAGDSLNIWGETRVAEENRRIASDIWMIGVKHIRK